MSNVEYREKKATLGTFALSKYLYVLVFMAGAVAFLYPLTANIINYQAQTRVITKYEEEVAQYNEEQLEGLKQEAQEYNQFVAGLEGNVTDEITDVEADANNVVYMGVLATGEAIGYVKIPKIDTELPIYRGTSEEVLNRGVGHLERSSLPIGGESTHTALSGHRGLPTARLFRDLGLLEGGDIVLLNSLGATLAYEVEDVRTVLPTEVESLQIQEGRDLCTLITCDPYMINSHRLLVTGHRVAYDPAYEQSPADSISFFQKYWEYVGIVGFFAALMLMIYLVRRYRKRKRMPYGGTNE